MRLLRAFCSPCDLARRENRPHSHRETRESVDSALLPVDHTDPVSALEPGRTERLDGLRGRSSGGDHVLDQADAIARLEPTLEQVAGAVTLLGLPDDQERQSGAKRGRGGEYDRPELGPCEPDRIGLDL